MTKTQNAGAVPEDKFYQRAAIRGYLASLSAEAPIKAIWARPEFEAKLLAFEAADSQALTAQAKYHRLGRFVLLALPVGGLIGAILLLPAWLVNAWVADAMGVLYIVVLVAALVVAKLLSAMSRVESWMKARGEAEQLRGEIFELVLHAQVPPGADVRTCTAQKCGLIQSAYFDHQLKYFASVLNPKSVSF